jgi:hypothetical protein
MMRTLLASFLLLVDPCVGAQEPAFRDFIMLPIEQAHGISHFAECPSYSDVCTVWVRVPKEIDSVRLLYPDREDYRLNVGLSMFDLSQNELDSTWKPGALHTFLSGGFTGFNLQVSRKLAKRMTIWFGRPERGNVYELKSLSIWLPERH